MLSLGQTREQTKRLRPFVEEEEEEEEEGVVNSKIACNPGWMS